MITSTRNIFYFIWFEDWNRMIKNNIKNIEMCQINIYKPFGYKAICPGYGIGDVSCNILTVFDDVFETMTKLL